MAFISQTLLLEFSLVCELRWMHVRPVRNSNSIAPNICTKMEIANSRSKYIVLVQWENRTRACNTYNLLHSRFIWLPLAISCIIRNLVESSSDVGAASALVGVGTIGAWTGPVVTGTGAIGLNAVFSWAIVKLFTCSMSLIIQKPPPIFFVMTRERWNDRNNGSDRDVDAVCFSRNIPVTVNRMIFSWNGFAINYGLVIQSIFNFRKNLLKITVNNVKSTANDCGSCSVAGRSFRNDTIWNFPFLSWFIFEFKSRMRFKLRLYCRYCVNLSQLIEKRGQWDYEGKCHRNSIRFTCM